MFSSSEEAEMAFYNAFSRGSIEEMKQVWAPERGIICIHPSGPKLVGPDSVHRSWKLILQANRNHNFKINNCEINGTSDFRIHTLEEIIKVGNSNPSVSVVYATNIYRKFQKGWLMVLHHASVAPETLIRSKAFEVADGKGTVVH